MVKITKKKNTSIIIVTVISLATLLAVLLLLGPIASSVHNCDKAKLAKADAQVDVATLNKLTVINGKTQAATALVSVECRENYSASSGAANAHFIVNDTIGKLDTDITGNLTKQGYTTDNIFIFGGGGGPNNGITKRYTKDHDTLSVTYILTKDYNCPESTQPSYIACPKPDPAVVTDTQANHIDITLSSTGHLR